MLGFYKKNVEKLLSVIIATRNTQMPNHRSRSRSPRRNRRSRSIKRGGDGESMPSQYQEVLSAKALMNKYKDVLPQRNNEYQQKTASVLPPEYKPRAGKSREELRLTRATQMNNCALQGQKADKTCKTLIAGPNERRRCRDLAQEAVGNAQKLTRDYAAKMEQIIEQCADKRLTEDEFKQCQKDLAEASQEYAALCNSMMSPIAISFGTRTTEARLNQIKGAANKAAKNIAGLFPGQKSKQETEQLKGAMTMMIDGWTKYCVGNPNLVKANGMEAFPFSCGDLRGITPESRNAMANEMVQISKGNNQN